MKRKSKCVAMPQGFKDVCDGCKTCSTKCPYRDKYRDLRANEKRQTEKEIYSQLWKG